MEALKCFNEECHFWDDTFEANCSKGEVEPAFDIKGVGVPGLSN